MTKMKMKETAGLGYPVVIHCTWGSAAGVEKKGISPCRKVTEML